MWLPAKDYWLRLPWQLNAKVEGLKFYQGSWFTLVTRVLWLLWLLTSEPSRTDASESCRIVRGDAASGRARRRQARVHFLVAQVALLPVWTHTQEAAAAGREGHVCHTRASVQTTTGNHGDLGREGGREEDASKQYMSYVSC